MDVIRYFLPDDIVYEIYMQCSWYELYNAYLEGDSIAASDDIWTGLMMLHFPDETIYNIHIDSFLSAIWKQLRILRYELIYSSTDNKVKEFIRQLGEKQLCQFLFRYHEYEEDVHLWILKYVSESVRNSTFVINTLIEHEPFKLLYTNMIKRSIKENRLKSHYATDRFKNNNIKLVINRYGGYALHYVNEKFHDNEISYIETSDPFGNELTFNNESLFSSELPFNNDSSFGSGDLRDNEALFSNGLDTFNIDAYSITDYIK